MFECLKAQFKNREIKKIYLALVYGELTDSSGKIDFAIGTNRHAGKMAARPKSTEIESKSAVTLYEVLKQFQHYGFLKIEIKTGRTHQIRVHLNALGHPVVGDEIYKPKNLKSRVKLGRIFLHAHVLGFNDIDGEWQEFECEMAEELDDKELKKLAPDLDSYEEKRREKLIGKQFVFKGKRLERRVRKIERYNNIKHSNRLKNNFTL